MTNDDKDVQKHHFVVVYELQWCNGLFHILKNIFQGIKFTTIIRINDFDFLFKMGLNNVFKL